MPARAREWDTEHGHRPLREYAVRRHRSVGGFEKHRCPHLRLLPATENSGSDLREALEGLLQREVVHRLCRMREGREVQFLAGEPSVERVATALKASADSRHVVEAFLDDLFEDLEKGTIFEHNEVAMALLYALRESAPTYFHDVAQPFAAAKTAEVGLLQRFAETLLAQ